METESEILAAMADSGRSEQGLIEPKFLELLVCPLTKEPLKWDAERKELVSAKARLAYPVRDGVPVMLPSEARPLNSDQG